MPRSGGLKVDGAPYLDRKRPPENVQFSPDAQREIAAREQGYLELYDKVAADFARFYPQLEQLRASQFGAPDPYTDQIRQPTTAGKGGGEKPGVVFRIEVIDRKGRIIGYHEIKPEHAVTEPMAETPEGRIGRVYDGYKTGRDLLVDEATAGRDHMRRAHIELDEKDLARLDARAAQMRSEHKGSRTRIVVIGA